MNTLKAASKVLFLSASLIVAVGFGPPVSAQEDSILVTYQGYLTDSDGNPIDGDHTLAFTIYDSEGTALWTEEHPSVPITNGLFSVILGSEMRLLPFSGWDEARDPYASTLGITVGSDPEMVPRTPLTSVFSAGVTKRVVGDIVTAPGGLQIAYPALCVDADPCISVFDVSVTDSSTALTLTTRPSDPTEPIIETVIEAGDQESDFEVVVSAPGNDDVTPVSIGTNIADGSSHMVLSTPGGEAILELKTGGSSGSPGVTIKSQSSGIFRSGDKTLTLDEDGFVEEASDWDESTGDSSWTFMRLDAAGANAGISSRQAGGHTAVAMTSDDIVAQLTLLNGDPTEPADVVLRALPDGGGQIGINTANPGEALDVVGTTQTTGFKMPTGAADGHVLTSDGDGNGTWQAPASSSRCGESGEFDGEVNTNMVEDAFGTTTINFASAFTSTEKPHMHVVVVLKQSANGLVEGSAIKAVVDIKGAVNNWTGFDITVSKYSDGTSIDDTTQVYVIWMAIRP